MVVIIADNGSVCLVFCLGKDKDALIHCINVRVWTLHVDCMDCFVVSFSDMWMFACLFPAVLLSLHLLSCNEARYRRAAVFGLFCGAVFTVLAILFTSGYHVYPAFFLSFFFNLFLFESLVPFAVLSAIAFLLFKGEAQYKAAVLFPLFLGFFVLYIPFRVFFRSDFLSFFVLFVKPVLLVSSVVGVAQSVGLLMAGVGKERRAVTVVPVCVLGVTSAVAPAAAEVCWFMGLPMALWIIVGLVGLCSPFLLVAWKHLGLDGKLPVA